MNLGTLLTNLALRQLVVHDVPADVVVTYYDDGSVIDDAEEALHLFADHGSEEVSLQAQEVLEQLLAARARRLDA